MAIENTTPNRGYQLPHGANQLADDVLRIIAAIGAIDVDMAARIVEIAGKASAVHGHVLADVTGLVSALAAKQDASGRGSANGYAALGADGKIPASQLPDSVVGSLKYQTGWNAATNTPTIPAASAANKGWYYIVETAGGANVSGITDWEIGDWLVSDGVKWSKIDNTDQVVSVAGLKGAIAAAALFTALGLGSAATKAIADFASAAQGTKADAALPKAGGALTGATGGDPGSGKLNAKGYQVNGKALWGAPDVLMQDQKASGTNGGTPVAGVWQTRDLNTVVADPSGLITLTSNRFTSSVDGYLRWICPAIYASGHKSRLYNVTDSVVAAIGSSAITYNNSLGSSETFGSGYIVAGKSYRIEHRVDRSDGATGFGRACGFGDIEVYTQAEFWRAG